MENEQRECFGRKAVAINWTIASPRGLAAVAGFSTSLHVPCERRARFRPPPRRFASSREVLSLKLAMTTAELRSLLLRALTSGPGHGTLLAARITSSSGGRSQPHSARVYEALRALARDGHIEPCAPEKRPLLQRRRSALAYRLTERGWEVARALSRAAFGADSSERAT